MDAEQRGPAPAGAVEAASEPSSEDDSASSGSMRSDSAADSGMAEASGPDEAPSGLLSRHKAAGNDAFHLGDFERAITCYSNALELVRYALLLVRLLNFPCFVGTAGNLCCSCRCRRTRHFMFSNLQQANHGL